MIFLCYDKNILFCNKKHNGRELLMQHVCATSSVFHASQTTSRNVRKIHQGIGFIESTPFGFKSFEADSNDPLGWLTFHIFVMPQRLQNFSSNNERYMLYASAFEINKLALRHPSIMTTYMCLKIIDVN